MAQRGSFADRAPHFRRTRERNLVYIRMLHQRFAGRSIAGDDVYDAGGEAGLLADVREGERRQGRKFRGLQHDGIFPVASAGAIFQATMSKGKFHGMI